MEANITSNFANLLKDPKELIFIKIQNLSIICRFSLPESQEVDLASFSIGGHSDKMGGENEQLYVLSI